MSYQDEAQINSTAPVVNQSLRRILEGHHFTLSGAAVGYDNLASTNDVTIEWFKDGEPTGLTGNTLTIENITEADAGNYTFRATNRFGTEESEGCEIEVVKPNESHFKVNLVQNGYCQDGISNWSQTLGTLTTQKVWQQSGDGTLYGGSSFFPYPHSVDDEWNTFMTGQQYFHAAPVSKRITGGSDPQWSDFNVNTTVAYQDILISDQDTMDIIDRKIEGVYDVECKCFGWLAQHAAAKAYEKDSSVNGGHITSWNQGDDFVPTVRHVHDEAKLRYEFFDMHDRMTDRFELDSFRPTKREADRKGAFACNFRNVSLAPGTRRIRVTMTMTRDMDREYEWSAEYHTFAQEYRCAVAFINCRLFINKDGLQFPNITFDMNQLIDINALEGIESDIAECNIEKQHMWNLWGDTGNIQLRLPYNTTDVGAPDNRELDAMKDLARYARFVMKDYLTCGQAVGGDLPANNIYVTHPRPGSTKCTFNNLYEKINILPEERIRFSKTSQAKRQQADNRIFRSSFSKSDKKRLCKSNYRPHKGGDHWSATKFAHVANFIFHHKSGDVRTIDIILNAYKSVNNYWWRDKWENHVKSFLITNNRRKRFYRRLGFIGNGSDWKTRITCPDRVQLAIVLAMRRGFNPMKKKLRYMFGIEIKPTAMNIGSTGNKLRYVGDGNEPFSFWFSGGPGSQQTYENIKTLFGTPDHGLSELNYGPAAANKQYLTQYKNAALGSQASSTFNSFKYKTISQVYDCVVDGHYGHHKFKDTVAFKAPHVFNWPDGGESTYYTDVNDEDADTWIPQVKSDMNDKQSAFWEALRTHMYLTTEDITNFNNSSVTETSDEGIQIHDTLEGIFDGQGLLSQDSIYFWRGYNLLTMAPFKYQKFSYRYGELSNYGIGFMWPCARYDECATYTYWGANSHKQRHKSVACSSALVSPAKVYLAGPAGQLAWKRKDYWGKISHHKVFDYTLGGMMRYMDENPVTSNWASTVCTPLWWDEDISIHPSEYIGEPTGNFDWGEGSTIYNTWHGSWNFNLHMVRIMQRKYGTGAATWKNFDEGATSIASAVALLNGLEEVTSFNGKHLFSPPEFYKHVILSGDTTNMPEDAPFRYQQAFPDQWGTTWDPTTPENVERYGDLDLIDNIDNSNPTQSRYAAVNPVQGESISFENMRSIVKLRFATRLRIEMLSQRIKYLNTLRDDAEDWKDNNSDQYGYDDQDPNQGESNNS